MKAFSKDLLLSKGFSINPVTGIYERTKDELRSNVKKGRPKNELSKEEVREALEHLKEPEGKQFIERTLKENNIPFEKEKLVVKGRKFRFDYYFVIGEKRIGAEYEGVFNTPKSRHTTVGGYSKDCEKYSIASLEGYIVLRYTSANYKDFSGHLKKLME